ncbi:hypothetical protein TVAG_486770 [Trichomonas vaginalis G3]|uniref:Right handed beta helix domain-containing protein n=1 Tax=Trichomonas vaginalis (strain ATCC PRA-98 / G3) TaxID=412133 RepID=A2DZA5_TRIV3|nr:bifunctional inhibitor/lipid-transfer protein/seed storage 2s albumin superfamily protein family [Trichomonas vaginalis G3]EAY14234.1 hypothetical protein TVAG_486770 [Trichomonas vaginalis G3]KAI5491908.1 bifunctional inhibitor/lipid-transfer protein/seed storage 2s albumin superfamily protein family [Trichomonas vaginalis G3]|eukprot:XP_001326457.1 hypothetical protein [Trichomonas vaginalis G3]
MHHVTILHSDWAQYYGTEQHTDHMNKMIFGSGQIVDARRNVMIFECVFIRIHPSDGKNALKIDRSNRDSYKTLVSQCSFYDCSVKGWGGAMLIATNGGECVLDRCCGQKCKSSNQGTFANLNVRQAQPCRCIINSTTALHCAGRDQDFQTDSTICVTNSLLTIRDANLTQNKAKYGTAFTFRFLNLEGSSAKYLSIDSNVNSEQYGIICRDNDETSNQYILTLENINILHNSFTDSSNGSIFSYYNDRTIKGAKNTNINNCNIRENNAKYLAYSNFQASVFTFRGCFLDVTLGRTCVVRIEQSASNSVDNGGVYYYTENCIFYDATAVETPYITVVETPYITVVETPYITVVETPYITAIETPYITVVETPYITVVETPYITVVETPYITVVETPYITVVETPYITAIETPYITAIETPYITAIETPYITAIETPYITAIETPYITAIETPYITAIETPYITVVETPYITVVETPYITAIETPYITAIETPYITAIETPYITAVETPFQTTIPERPSVEDDPQDGKDGDTPGTYDKNPGTDDKTPRTDDIETSETKENENIPKSSTTTDKIEQKDKEAQRKKNIWWIYVVAGFAGLLLLISGIIFFLWMMREDDSTEEVETDNVDKNNEETTYLDSLTVNDEEYVINPDFDDYDQEITNPDEFFIMQVEE